MTCTADPPLSTTTDASAGASPTDPAPAERSPGVDPLEFRRVMGRFATGVAIVTTTDAEGAPLGITVNSLSSVSLDPPLLLWSIDQRASSLGAFRARGAFAVNLLPVGAAELCRRFSRSGIDRFAGVPWEVGPLGLPLLQGMTAHLCCRTWARHPGGDHEIIVGEVRHVRGWDAEPLVFHLGQLTRLAAATNAPGVPPVSGVPTRVARD
jgi:flavin reductase (DIM6/NTAB) family NADH-FMN oxidoreductase RutF